MSAINHHHWTLVDRNTFLYFQDPYLQPVSQRRPWKPVRPLPRVLCQGSNKTCLHFPRGPSLLILKGHSNSSYPPLHLTQSEQSSNHASLGSLPPISGKPVSLPGKSSAGRGHWSAQPLPGQGREPPPLPPAPPGAGTGLGALARRSRPSLRRSPETAGRRSGELGTGGLGGSAGWGAGRSIPGN